MRVLVHGGQLVTESAVLSGDVVCEDGRIIALADPDGRVAVDEVIDANGKLVFPGFIDPHVHSRDPGMTHKEDFAHATLGALTGGVTTILEMPNAIPPVDSVKVYEERRAYLGRSAWTDFGLWGLALGDSNLDQICPLFEAGAVGVKLFWGYALRRDTRALVYNSRDESPENLILPPNNGAVLRLFREVARVGGLLAAHCEDKDILNTSESMLGHPIESYEDLLVARPDTAEAVTISIAASLAAATGCRFHVVHMASAAGAAAVRAARDRGIPITAESCPQYLTLTAEDYPRVGPVMKVYPPIRGESDQAALWNGIADDFIVSVGSDHAPHTVEEKSGDLATQPAGAVGCETLGPLMVDAMIRGRLRATRLAAVLSSSTARLYGLYPRKGAILPGSDADLTIVDPAATRTIRNENLVAKQPISPWHGTELRGAPCMAVLRGDVVMRDGEPIGDRRGQYVGANHALLAAEPLWR
jgi:allantoinase